VRLLADESVRGVVVRALRAEGHDVVFIAEDRPGISDEQVLEGAVSSERVLITEDQGFGRRIYLLRLRSRGVVLLRYPTRIGGEFARDVAALITREGDRLTGAFAVIRPGKARIRRLP